MSIWDPEYLPKTPLSLEQYVRWLENELSKRDEVIADLRHEIAERFFREIQKTQKLKKMKLSAAWKKRARALTKVSNLPRLSGE